MKLHAVNIKNSNRVNAIKLSTLALVVSSLVACGGGEGIVDTSTTTDSSPTTSDNGTGTSSSTQGVLCEYSYSEYNESESVQATSAADWSCTGTTRDLVANGIPDHEVGTFPNADNPNTISEQSVNESYTLEPVETTQATMLGGLVE